jgi:hypothetical protein
VPAALHLALLGVASASLWAAGLRVAGRAGADGVERAIAAAVLAAAAAVLQTLCLALVELGGSAAALAVAALATWIGARLLLPAPAPLRLPSLPPRSRIAAGCLAGAGAAWCAWLLAEPQVGFDSSHYHWAEVAVWLESGRPGSDVGISPDIPYGSYPLTNEVLLAWLAGIGRSFVPLALWSAAMLALLAASAWSALRRLRVDPLLAGAAVAALCSVPFLVRQLGDSGTDLPALAWLAAAGALCAAAPRAPGLLPVALLAAALAVGTKTTAVVPAAAVLAAGALACRGRLSRLRVPLAAAAAAGLAVGGTWYLRNLLEHGSPLWPFVGLPGSDPAPRMIELVDHSFLERPRATLDGNLSGYAERLAGALVLVPAALAAPLVARERRVAPAAGVALVSLIAWANAPVTGLGDPALAFPDGYALSASRYLLPAVAACVLTVALAGAAGGRRRRAALAVLWLAVALNVAGNVALNDRQLPPPALLAGGILALGAVAALPLPRPPRPSGPAWVALAAAGGALLALPSHGFVDRHSEAEGTPILGRPALRWLADRERFREGDDPVAVGRIAVAALAGDRFRHELVPLGPDDSCAGVRRRAAGGWLVVTDLRFASGLEPFRVLRCVRGLRPRFEGGGFRVYALPRG